MKFSATVSLGESRILQAPGSDVSLLIPEESPGVYRTLVHTDLSSLMQQLPNEECFISPPVAVEFSPLKRHAGESLPRRKCALKIPHCLRNDKLWEQISVRRYITSNDKQVVEDLVCDRRAKAVKEGVFQISSGFIRITTTGFSVFTCTRSDCHNSCQAVVHAFLFGRLDHPTNETKTIVRIKLCLTSYLYRIEDFRQVCLQLRPILFSCLHSQILFNWPVSMNHHSFSKMFVRW